MWQADELSSCRYTTEVLGDRYDRNRLLLQWVGRDKDVLELGCSTGFLSRRLAAQGCRIVGVELDPVAARMAERFCDRVIVSDLADATWDTQLPPSGFDVVLMGDVLEHLANPSGTLRRVRPLLRKSGYLVISLPNVLHWVTRLGFLSGSFEYTPFGTLDFTHLRFFTARSATELIEQSGFRVSRFHPAIGGRLSGRFRPVWQQLANTLPGLFAYQLLFRAEP